jgi:hypothetical protein
VGRRFRLFVIVTLAVASCAQARRAQAATTEADALVNQAVELRRNGDDEGALALLLRAYALDHPPRATGQLGLCEQALGRWADAEAYLTEVLKAEKDPWVEKNRRTLEDALAIVKSHIARIEVDGKPIGAEVWVNGTLVGKLPLSVPVHVAAGEEIEVELRTPGFVSELKTLRLEAGQYQRIVLRASQVPAPPTLAPPPPLVPTPAASTTTVNVPEAQAEKPPGTIPATASNGRRALKWVAWGLGAAALGVGIYGWIGNSSGVSTFNNSQCSIKPGDVAVDPTGTPSTPCADLESRYESRAKIGIAGFVSAGAFALAGFGLWLSEPWARTHDDARVTCAPTMSHRLDLTLGCALRF